ncbi:MAG TPA: hypothetical protein VNK04_19050 [Gemmataceae bacterium]|nr:hypothetical protein [Gemmataceae bacterium]
MDWHRFLGFILMDILMGTPYTTEQEKDLSLKKQLLDLVIVRRGPGTVPFRLPDGLEDLANHNLITFKSYQETLDAWAMKELIGHYVNYRKQVSPSLKDLLPEEEFRLYAICARYPHNLAQQVPWEEVQQGVYRCRWGTDDIRVIVLRQVPLEEHNALWHLFSGVPERVAYGARHYQLRSPDTSALLHQLFAGYKREGLNMPLTMDDFRREYVKEHLHKLTPEERLEGLSAEEILRGLSAEEILKHLPREEIENFLKRQKDGSPPSAE